MISHIKTSYKLNFFLMSPWTIRNKPIKPKDRLKILLMVIFWSDPSKYPSPMVRSISNTASEPICPSFDPWNEFSATIFRTMPSMTRISENELHPSKSELCKNTSSRYEQTISTEKIMISETISIPNVRKMRTVDRLHFRFLTNAYLFFSFLSLSKFSTSIGCNF